MAASTLARWLLVAAAAVTMAATWGSARHHGGLSFNDNGCPNVMGMRREYAFVNDVCHDCNNIYRDDTLFMNCRRNCFFNEDFLFCVQATNSQDRLPELRVIISLLNIPDPSSTTPGTPRFR